MSWIYFRDMVESPELLAHGSEPSLIVKLTRTAKAIFCQKCKGVVLTARPSGMTCVQCEKRPSDAKSEGSPADGLVQDIVEQDLARAWKMTSPRWQRNSFALFANLDLDGVFSKMSQGSLMPDLEPTGSSANLPRQGIWDDTGLYHVTMWPRTRGIRGREFGSRLPTPTYIEATKQSGPRKSNGPADQGSLTRMSRHGQLPTPTARDYRDGWNPKRHGRHSPSLPLHLARIGQKGYLNPRFSERLMGLPPGAVKLSASVEAWFHRLQGKRSGDC